MKNIKIMLVLFLLILISACAKNQKFLSSGESVELNITSESGSVMESSNVSATKVTNIKTTMRPLSELNLGEPDEWNFNSRTKEIFLCENGYYYYFEKGDVDGPHRVLAFDSGDGNRIEQVATDNFTGVFLHDNDIYGYQEDSGVCKYENGVLTVFPNTQTYNIYFSESGIYFSGIDESVIYRMDYTGENITPIAKLNKHQIEICDFAIYKGKIWYDYIDREISGMPQKNFATYDLETKEVLEFDNGRVGLINNSYMYYTDDDSKFYRFNCETYCVEKICDATVEAFDFSGGFILYATEDAVYKLNEKENKKILSVNQLGKSDYFLAIQCQNDRIFILSGSGAFYTYLAEIDINGKIIKKIHEDL